MAQQAACSMDLDTLVCLFILARCRVALLFRLEPLTRFLAFGVFQGFFFLTKHF